jgi:hypothetical protein
MVCFFFARITSNNQHATLLQEVDEVHKLLSHADKDNDLKMYLHCSKKQLEQAMLASSFRRSGATIVLINGYTKNTTTIMNGRIRAISKRPLV